MPIPLKDHDLSWQTKYGNAVKDLAYNKGTEVLIFARELARLCKVNRFNLPGMFAQAWHETDGFTSEAWVRRRNPAGIKYADRDTYQSYYNGVDAARAFVVHMSAYVRPDSAASLAAYFYLDKRYRTALSANVTRRYSTFDDLTLRWATDPAYGNQISRVFRELFGAPE